MAGQSYNQIVVLQNPAPVVSQDVVSSVAGANGVTVTTAGPGSIIITRTYIPTWAIVLGILGLLFFLVGIIFFFMKETESLTITLSPLQGGGTEVRATGTASPEVIGRLNAVFAHGRTEPSSQATLPTRDLQPVEFIGAAPVSAVEASPIAQELPGASLETRLERVRDLLDQGLISEEDAARQRMRLLGEAD